MGADVHRWRCSCCGEEQTGLPMDAHFGPPVDWASLDEAAQAASCFDDDFCYVQFPDGEITRLIRGLLPLPVPQLDSEFRFGVWVSISERSWDIYRAGFGHGTYAERGCFGYLVNTIPDYPASMHLHADVMFEPDGLRPTIHLHDADHPLVAAQRDGIDVAQVERWAAAMHGPG